MTLANEYSRITYEGDGQTTDFPIPFRFFDEEIAVYYNKTNQKYLSPKDYLIYNHDERFIRFHRPPAQGVCITIIREMKLHQLTTFIEGERFPASAYENSLDRIYMALQELHEKISRAFLVAPGVQSITEAVYTKTEIDALFKNYYTKSDTDFLFCSADEIELRFESYYTKKEINQVLGMVEKKLSEV